MSKTERFTVETTDRNLPPNHSRRSDGVQVLAEVTYNADGIPTAREIEASFVSGVRDEEAVLFCLQQAEEACR